MVTRTVLEYSCSVWDPYTIGSVRKIENIQRRAARFVLNRYHRRASVTDMLSTLKWQPLQKRRQAARLTMLYKVHNREVQVDASKLKLLADTGDRARRGHNQQFQRLSSHTQDYRMFSFLPRTIREWNELPSEVVTAPSVDSFRSRVTKHVLHNQLDRLASARLQAGL